MCEIITDGRVIPRNARRTALQRTVGSEPDRAVILVLRPALASVGRAQAIPMAATAMRTRERDLLIHIGRKREHQQNG